MLKSFWTAIRGQVSGAVDYVDQDFALQVSEMLDTVETRVSAAEEKAESVFTTFDLAKFKGKWNPATGLPALPATPASNGEWYEISAPGSSNITGSPENFETNDRLIGSDTAWFRIPQGSVPGDGSVSPEKFIAWIQDMFGQLPSGSPYFWVLMDAMNRIGLAIKKDGSIEGKFVINAINMMANSVATAAMQNGSVTMIKLAADVLTQLLQPFDATNSAYWFLFMDSLNRIAFGIRKDGQLDISKLNVLLSANLPNGSIKEEWLKPELASKIPSAAFLRLNSANLNDVAYIADGLIRASEFPIFEKTSAVGTRFQELMSVETPYLKGVNDTGTDIQIVANGAMVIRGKRYRGTFDPNAAGVSSGTAGTIGLVDKGVYGNFATNSYPALPVLAAGEFVTVDGGTVAGAITRNGITFKHGDLIVGLAGGGYAVQAAPGDGSFVIDDFWNVTANGIFAGVQYYAGQRIYFNGTQTAGGPRYARFMPSKAGEYYYMGSCTSSAFAPVSPLLGDIYDSTFAGTITASNINVAIGDFVFYLGGWGIHEGKMKTIVSGQAFHLPCRDASEYSIRRADKSNVSVTLKAYGQRGTVSQRALDEIHAISDSMLGTNGMATKLATLTGRTVTLNSYGGSTFEEELRMMYYNIMLKGDPNKGKTVIVMGGQNNGTDVTSIKRAAFMIDKIIGSRQKRVLYLSFTGTQTATHNGTRIVVANAEQAYGTNGLDGTNFIAEVEQFYRNAFPLQFVNCRQIMLDAAVGRTTIDLRFPGMTEAQVAATYRIPPKSFFNEAAGKPNKSLCNYLGLWTSAALPTGGNDNDYYLRTANGVVGNEIIKVAGVWTEFADDNTHWSDLGAQTIANGVAAALTSKNL